MKKKTTNQEMDAADLPQNEVFSKKEVFQYPQPASMSLPLQPAKQDKTPSLLQDNKEEQKTSKEQGLNEERSQGDAGAFEGLEDHSKQE